MPISHLGARSTRVERPRAERDDPPVPATHAIQADGKKPKALPFEEMVRLMRVETERAQRHGYPISCVLIAADGFDDAEDAPKRKRYMRAVFKCLKSVCFRSEVQGLGAATDEYQVAVFPHYKPDAVNALMAEVQDQARRLKREDGSALTLSIGLSHNQHQHGTSFETLIADAETGLGVSRSSGGNRITQWRDVETELDRLREELDAQIDEIEKSNAWIANESEALGETWGLELIRKIRKTFEDDPANSADVVRVEKAVVQVVHGEMTRWAESELATQLVERTRRADMLDRRVRKLSELLEITEKELKRVAAAKSIDTGISSIYRTVQGINDEDDQAETKKELMKSIFEANLALRKAPASKGMEESKRSA